MVPAAPAAPARPPPRRHGERPGAADAAGRPQRPAKASAATRQAEARGRSPRSASMRRTKRREAGAARLRHLFQHRPELRLQRDRGARGRRAARSVYASSPWLGFRPLRRRRSNPLQKVDAGVIFGSRTGRYVMAPWPCVDTADRRAPSAAAAAPTQAGLGPRAALAAPAAGRQGRHRPGVRDHARAERRLDRQGLPSLLTTPRGRPDRLSSARSSPAADGRRLAGQPAGRQRRRRLPRLHPQPSSSPPRGWPRSAARARARSTSRTPTPGSAAAPATCTTSGTS